MPSSIIVNADLRIDLNDQSASLKASGRVIDFDLESFGGFAALRKSMPKWRSHQHLRLWLIGKDLAIRVSVNQMVVVVIGKRTEESGFSVVMGKGLRIWPFRLAGAMWQK